MYSARQSQRLRGQVSVRTEGPAQVGRHDREAELRFADACCSLSPREVEIIRLVAKGYPNKTIAGVLDISPWTVATHLRRIYLKLGVSSRTAMVAKTLHVSA